MRSIDNIVKLNELMKGLGSQLRIVHSSVERLGKRNKINCCASMREKYEDYYNLYADFIKKYNTILTKIKKGNRNVNKEINEQFNLTQQFFNNLFNFDAQIIKLQDELYKIKDDPDKLASFQLKYNMPRVPKNKPLILPNVPKHKPNITKKGGRRRKKGKKSRKRKTRNKNNKK